MSENFAQGPDDSPEPRNRVDPDDAHDAEVTAQMWDRRNRTQADSDARQKVVEAAIADGYPESMAERMADDAMGRYLTRCIRRGE